MPYLIDATDKPGNQVLRQANRPAHLRFLEEHLRLLIAAGAKLSDDGTTSWGSIYIVDVEDRPAAEAFIAKDPYSAIELFERVTITRWRKGFFDFKRVPPAS